MSQISNSGSLNPDLYQNVLKEVQSRLKKEANPEQERVKEITKEVLAKPEFNLFNEKAVSTRIANKIWSEVKGTLPNVVQKIRRSTIERPGSPFADRSNSPRPDSPPVIVKALSLRGPLSRKGIKQEEPNKAIVTDNKTAEIELIAKKESLSSAIKLSELGEFIDFEPEFEEILKEGKLAKELTTGGGKSSPQVKQIFEGKERDPKVIKANLIKTGHYDDKIITTQLHVFFTTNATNQALQIKTMTYDKEAKMPSIDISIVDDRFNKISKKEHFTIGFQVVSVDKKSQVIEERTKDLAETLIPAGSRNSKGEIEQNQKSDHKWLIDDIKNSASEELKSRFDSFDKVLIHEKSKMKESGTGQIFQDITAKLILERSKVFLKEGECLQIVVTREDPIKNKRTSLLFDKLGRQITA